MDKFISFSQSTLPKEIIKYIKVYYHSKNTIEIRMPPHKTEVRVLYEVGVPSVLKKFNLKRESLEHIFNYFLKDGLILFKAIDGDEFIVYEQPRKEINYEGVSKIR